MNRDRDSMSKRVGKTAWQQRAESAEARIEELEAAIEEALRQTNDEHVGDDGYPVVELNRGVKMTLILRQALSSPTKEKEPKTEAEAFVHRVAEGVIAPNSTEAMRQLQADARSILSGPQMGKSFAPEPPDADDEAADSRRPSAPTKEKRGEQKVDLYAMLDAARRSWSDPEDFASRMGLPIEWVDAYITPVIEGREWVVTVRMAPEGYAAFKKWAVPRGYEILKAGVEYIPARDFAGPAPDPTPNRGEEPG